MDRDRAAGDGEDEKGPSLINYDLILRSVGNLYPTLSVYRRRTAPEDSRRSEPRSWPKRPISDYGFLCLGYCMSDRERKKISRVPLRGNLLNNMEWRNKLDSF